MLKKIILTLAILMLAVSAAHAVDLRHSADQVTVAWDAVTTSTDGTAIEGSVKYVVYTDSVNHNAQSAVWEGTDTQAAITFDKQGRYLVGVKALLVVDGAVEGESSISWSDDPLAVGAGTFGAVYFKNPNHPVNFVKQ